MQYTLHAQAAARDNVGIGIKSKGGILLAHRPVMAHLVQGHTFAIETSINLQADGDKAWEQKLNYPSYGFTFFASSTGNRDVIGNAFAGFTYIDIPVFKISEKLNFSTKIGAGIGLVSKPFSQEKNPKNVAIGSKINGYIQLGAFLNYRNKQHLFNFGVDMSHFSNGASKLPNLGLNLPYISLGYNYFLKPVKSYKEEIKYTFSKKITLETIGIVAPKQLYPTGGRTFPVVAAALFAQKRFTPISGVELGLDIISNQSHFKVSQELEKTQLTVLQIGIYGGYLLHLNNQFKMYTGMGCYIKNTLNPAGYLYHRLGLRFATKKRLVLHVGIKSNFAKADYFEYGIGYKIR